MSNSKFMLVTSPVHGNEVLLGFVPDSANDKTGGMTQVFILHPDQDPVQASKEGQDERVCGPCPLRHSLGGACYVTLFQGPLSLYRGWERSGKKLSDIVEILQLCAGTKIRFGAYGDPAHIPVELVTSIMATSKGWTAYTHVWRDPNVAAFWKGKAMASCDTASQVITAEALGWKCFLASPGKIKGVPLCVNESKGTQCIDCMKCDGHHGSVRITPHGALMGRHPSVKKVAKI